MHLLLDSSGGELVCGLADHEGVILEERRRTGTPESRDIGKVAGEVLGELRIADLESVVVGTGPGSFIGTRVAISYANGLAANGGVALSGVDSLAAIAAVYGMGRSVVLRDARRGEVYFHGPAADEQATRLLPLDKLAHELATQRISTVVIEAAGDERPGTKKAYSCIRQACSEGGAQLVTCSGVPAEGLRRLRGTASTVEYVEPVYLRGFL